MPSEDIRSFMPSENLSLVLPNLKKFFYWMYERQNIWYKRFVLRKDKPWTDNEILNDYKFTNVYRELDRNTQWLIKNIIEEKNTNEEEVFWKIVVFRYFNKIELFEYMDGIPNFFDFKPKVFNKAVVSFEKTKGRVFTDAYMINPPKKPNDRELGLALFYCKHIETFHKRFKEFWDFYINISKLKEETSFELAKKFNAKLTELERIAKFIAYEIYCDLCYTDWFVFGINDFVNVGPGAKFGLELIFPNLFIKSRLFFYEEKISLLKDNSHKYFEMFGYKDFKYYNKSNYKDYKNGERLNLRCIEHSLCEFSKYWKMFMKVGKPRQKFVKKDDNLFI